MNKIPIKELGRKLRILLVNEGSVLRTGFSTYGFEIFKRLYATGKYELAELSSYVTQNDGRWKSWNIPWKYYGNLPDPNDTNAQREYQSNYNTNQFGEWKFTSTLLDFKPDVCTPPGTLIMTSDGYIPIENVKTGDVVLTHKGRFRKVAQTMRNPHNGDLYKIYFNGTNMPLKLTPNHPVLVYRKRQQQWNKKSVRKIYDNIEPEFVPAHNLKKGDLVVLPTFEEGITQQIDITKYLDNFVVENDQIRPQNHGNLVPKNVTISPKFARLLGYILGDGSIQTNNSQIFITFNITEQRFVEDVKSIVKDVFDLDAHVYTNLEKHCYTICIASTIITEFLNKWLKNKIPYAIWVSPKEIRQQFLAGLIRSDGCYKRQTINFVSTNKRLAYSVRMLYASIGIPCSLYKKIVKTTYGKCTSYDVNIYATEHINTVHDFVQKFDNGPQIATLIKKSCKRVQKINNHIVASIRRIRTEQYCGQVYNLEVEEDNSYILQTAVHNCIDIRDWWMLEFEERNPLRKMFTWCIMPTVDGFPQQRQWIETYKRAEYIFNYSYFGKHVLESQSAGAIKVTDVTNPGVDLDIFRPMDRKEALASFNLKSDVKPILFVSRNQRRKMFPDALEAYAIFKEKYPTQVKSVCLWFHTSWPDVGWNFPEIIKTHYASKGLTFSDVLFSYVCYACGHNFVSWYLGADVGLCQKCGKKEARMPNTQVGFSPERLAQVYQAAYIYVHPSIAEGDGMGINEAKACGLPVLGMPYSAVAEKVQPMSYCPDDRYLGGRPIKIAKKWIEPETHQFRVYPDNYDFAKQIKYLVANEDTRNKLAELSRQTAEKYYGWDRIAARWDKFFSEEVLIKDVSQTWNAPIELRNIDNDVPLDLNPQDFILACYKTYLSINKPDENGFKHWLHQLANGTPKENIIRYFKNEAIKHNQLEEARIGKPKPIETIYDYLDASDTFRILYVMPKTYGDVLLSTAVISGLKKKYTTSQIYFATEPQYFCILKNNLDIKGLIPYNSSLDNGKFIESTHLFKLAYTPHIISQQTDNYSHHGKGKHLMEAYADICDVIPDKLFIDIEKPDVELPTEYITIHTTSNMDSKNYDKLVYVPKYFPNAMFIQVGAKSDKCVDDSAKNIIDMRGKTTIHQMAYIIQHAILHIGVDSVPAHIAAAVGTMNLTIFGPTTPNICGPINYYGGGCIEPTQRGDCMEPCFMASCKFSKCINYISIKDVCNKIENIIEHRNDKSNQ